MKIETVDAHLSLPDACQVLLRKKRRTVKAAEVRSTEVISYNIPAYNQNGVLVQFGAYKNHIAFFPTSRGKRNSGKNFQNSSAEGELFNFLLMSRFRPIWCIEL